MHRVLSVLILSAMLMSVPAVPTAADDGCARALAATAGTPGQAFVAVHCSAPSTGTAPETPAVNSQVGAQRAVQGCATGLAAAAGTPGEPFVRAACDDLANRLGLAVPTQVSPPSTGTGCELAIQAVAGTSAEPFVRAGCAQAAAASAASPEATATTPDAGEGDGEGAGGSTTDQQVDTSTGG